MSSDRYPFREIEAKWQLRPNGIFYFAVPPSLFGVIAQRLREAGLASPPEHSRLVIEKPIGYDLAALAMPGLISATDSGPRSRMCPSGFPMLWPVRWRSPSPMGSTATSSSWGGSGS